MKQIAVSHVEFEHFKPRLNCSSRASRKLLHNCRDVIPRHLPRDGITRRECNGAGRNRLPRAGIGAERLAAAPWRIRGSLAAGVRELNARNSALSLDK